MTRLAGRVNRGYVNMRLVVIADRLTLAEASVSVPVKVKVLDSTSEKSSKCDLTGQTLLLRSVADDVFLRANAINGGEGTAWEPLQKYHSYTIQYN